MLGLWLASEWAGEPLKVPGLGHDPLCSNWLPLVVVLRIDRRGPVEQGLGRKEAVAVVHARPC